MVFIYILELQSGKYYIGKTQNPDARILSHFESTGSAWTHKYKPIKVLEIIKNCDDEDEDKYTIQYMKKYGINNVRGGSFSQLVLDEDHEVTLSHMITSSSDKCFRCGRIGHYSNECYAKTHDDGHCLKNECNDIDVNIVNGPDKYKDVICDKKSDNKGQNQ